MVIPEVRKSESSWHAYETSYLLNKLNSRPNHGLSKEEITERLIRFGTNSLIEIKPSSFVSMALRQFLSPLIYLLLAAAGIAFIVGETRDSLVIIGVVLLNAIMGAIQEGRAERSLESLRKLSSLKARVVRGGMEEVVQATQIVPGDILILSAGDAIASDSRLIETVAFTVAEAPLTGESVPVVKSISILPLDTPLMDRINMVYAGTHVTSGRARAVVVETGSGNEIGKIAALAQSTEQPKTQLEIRIDDFGKKLIYLALGVSLFVLSIGLIRGISFSEIFMLAMSQMVSLVPEGLPVAVTIALAVGVQRMAKRGSIVRRLSAVETLGSTTVICSDKTGTLTKNEMTVTAIFLTDGQRKIEVTGVGYLPEGKFIEKEGAILNPVADFALKRLFEVAVLCNDSELLESESQDFQWRILGDPTEAALLTLAMKGGRDFKVLREKYPREAELPFDSVFKMMATQHETLHGNYVFIKGAPDVMLDFCVSYDQKGKEEPLDKEMRAQVLKTAKEMAERALRVLALGYVKGGAIDTSKGFNFFKGKITLVGLVGEWDPPRGEVAESVKQCKRAGIRPVMVTGDHKATGIAIAKTLGISFQGDVAIEGKELDELSDEDLLKKLTEVSVFARVHPAQKLRIVKAYQQQGDIVAMTGDGVNDAPALMKANVGVAMGITGTEVAKEASKIIITDDNFATLVTAVTEGRLVYQNIKKTILFLFSTSMAEVIVLSLSLLMGLPAPFTAVQILWNNLVTEGIITLNLIMEPLEGNEMKRAPIPSDEHLFTKVMKIRIGLMTPTIALITLGWFIYRIKTEVPFTLVRSEVFTLLVVCEWFNVLNCRSETQSVFRFRIFKNRWLLGGLVLGSLLHIAVIYWPPLNKLFHTVPIALEQVFQIGILGSGVLWMDELRKIFTARYGFTFGGRQK